VPIAVIPACALSGTLPQIIEYLRVDKSDEGGRCGNAGIKNSAGKVERGEPRLTVDEVSKVDWVMSKTDGDPSSGLSFCSRSGHQAEPLVSYHNSLSGFSLHG